MEIKISQAFTFTKLNNKQDFEILILDFWFIRIFAIAKDKNTTKKDNIFYHIFYHGISLVSFFRNILYFIKSPQLKLLV